MALKKNLTLEQVIESLKATNGNMALAARRLNVDRSNIKYWIDNYATAKQAHDEAAAYVSDIAEGHLVNAVIKGNLDQVKYWLENKARDRGYGARYNVEVSGKDGGPIPFVFQHEAAVAAIASRSTRNPRTPGTDEGGSDGA